MATTINKLDDSNPQSQNSFSSVSNNALPQSPTNNLDISAATYLGGADDDYANAVDISVDGNFVIVGGSFKNTNLGLQETELLGGGDGSIVRYDAQTNQAVGVTSLPGKILDLEVSKNGDIAVAYEGGIAVLNADATQVKWSKPVNIPNIDRKSDNRIAISDSGKVGFIEDIPGTGDKAYLFDSDGTQLQELDTNSSARHLLDIAVTDQNGGMLITTGYDQKDSSLQVAFTEAISYQGAEIWKSYDFSRTAVEGQNLMADTRGQRVAIGRDGQLYASYKINGGTGFSIFSRDPNDISQKLGDDRKIETDKYNSPTNIGSEKIAWYGRYDLNTGDLIKGQSILGRNSQGKGKTVNVTSITATEDGTIILGGDAAGEIANREQQTIEGQQVSKYVSYDGYVATISSDFQERLSWTPVSKSSRVVAAYRNGTTAAVSHTNFAGNQITHNAIQDSKGGNLDGYLLVIGGNDAPPGTPPEEPGNPVTPPEEPENPVTPPEQPGNPVTPPEQPGNPVTPPEQPGNPITPPEQPGNPITPPEQPGNPITPPEQPGNPNTSSGSPTPPEEVKNPNPFSGGLTPPEEIENPNTFSSGLTPIEEPSNPTIGSSGGGDAPIKNNPQSIIEIGTDNSDSVFLAGLIDLTKVDLDRDNQVDEKVSVNFSGIESEAGYNNSVGYYAIANLNGAVEDSLTGKLINPGEEGYAKAAIDQRVQNLELRRDTGTLSSELDGGTMLLPFLIANGTAEEWLGQNSNNQKGNLPIAYFSVGEANPDNTSHIRQIGNELQFEDLFGGGDNDFNDFTTKVDIQPTV